VSRPAAEAEGIRWRTGIVYDPARACWVRDMGVVRRSHALWPLPCRWPMALGDSRLCNTYGWDARTRACFGNGDASARDRSVSQHGCGRARALSRAALALRAAR